jgi:A/G-specific adenine glycosylase
MVTANAAERLLQHYVDNFRRLPWRSPPGEPPPDPYRVWLSEIMLQQTTVAAVVPRFERFVSRWPNVEALAAASDEDILAEWAGLGYYARARNLIACAREIARRGTFPRAANELRRLPGIGDYTAAAIAAIAFGEQVAAVDTNVARVLTRYRGVEDRLEHSLHKSRGEIRRLAEEIVPPDRPGDFVQAMMDLGATICRPKQPRCEICPLQSDCAAYASGHPEAFSATRQKCRRPHKHGVAYWIERNGYVWLVRRPAKGMLGGMAALPGGDWQASKPRVERSVAAVRHVFTHFSLDLTIEARTEPVGEGWWQPLSRLDEAGLPTLYRKAAKTVLARDERLAA